MTDLSSLHPSLQSFVRSQQSNGATMLQALQQMDKVVRQFLIQYGEEHLGYADFSDLRTSCLEIDYGLYHGGGKYPNFWHNHSYREEIAHSQFLKVFAEHTGKGKGVHGPDDYTLNKDRMMSMEHKSSMLKSQKIGLSTCTGMVDKTDDKVTVTPDGTHVYTDTLGREIWDFSIFDPKSGRPLITTALVSPNDLSQPLSPKMVAPLINAVIEKSKHVIGARAAKAANDRPPRDALSISLKLVQDSQGIVLCLDSQRLLESGIELSPEVLKWACKSPIASVRHAVKQLQKKSTASLERCVGA